ncbi:MAG TPA: phosphate uptake regulator PhoU [Poseidonia sp.]|nr:phosphate uptake regulator PhoU [Poseidonia sp.]
MGLGLGEHEVRKLQSTGGSTFTVSLPKPWVVEQQLKARDSLRVDWRPSGALRITPLDLATSLEKHVYFNFETLPDNSLHDHLMGAYISGADLIAVECDAGNQQSLKYSIRRFLRSTRGFEIMEETTTRLDLRCLLNAGDMPLHASLNRMYLQVTSLMRDIVSVVDGAEKDFISDAEDRESEVDALLYLIERQVRILLDSHLVATKLNLSRAQALEYANLARCLERMMDHAFTMAQFITEYPQLIENPTDTNPIQHVSEWQSALKELMINIRTRDSARIEEARHQLKVLQESLLAYEHNMLNKKGTSQWVAQNLSLSESVRRLCAYSRDFGEILLNMKISSELMRVHRTVL